MVAILILVVSSNGFSSAASLSDLQKKQAELNQSIKDNAQKSKAAAQVVDKNAEDIEQLNKDIGDIESKINDTSSQISSTESDIENKNNDIKNKEDELALEKANQNELIREMYKNGTKGTLEIIISSSTLSEVISYTDYMESLQNRISNTISEINRLKAELEKQKQDLEAKKLDLDKLSDQQEAYKYGLDQQKAEKNKLLADAKSQKKSLDAQIAEAKKLSDQVNAQINAIFASMSSGTIHAVDRGTSVVGFQWPMNYNKISAVYGEGTPFQSFHSGIDLVNIAGTPVYAAADGTVTAVTDQMSNGQYYGYGKNIIIEHNARFATLYGHLMGFAVSMGQIVKKGDVIGYEGSTGWSTGPHLHFEIRENKGSGYAHVNPTTYLP
jgi:murein DD-endopeptidase MepM/ murein hydrolase activator NlpD